MGRSLEDILEDLRVCKEKNDCLDELMRTRLEDVEKRSSKNADDILELSIKDVELKDDINSNTDKITSNNETIHSNTDKIASNNETIPSTTNKTDILIECLWEYDSNCPWSQDEFSSGG